ncbi:hypothetical protein [Limnospira platensis]|uniref:hypothetical protein n=1 Tax=Limnospira platensis TaxID=118562 RepID=UPI00139F2B5A
MSRVCRVNSDHQFLRISGSLVKIASILYGSGLGNCLLVSSVDDRQTLYHSLAKIAVKFC